MQTKCILESICSIPGERIAFVSESRSISYGSILETYENNISSVTILDGACVSIRGQSRFDFALLLSILDGRVKRIVFMPEDIDDHLLSRYYGESGVNYEVSIENDKLRLELIRAFKASEHDSNEGFLTEWVIPTSGTTKKPKLVSHTFSSLTRSTLRDTEKGKEYIWGLTFDIYRFSGIQVFLQSILGGSSLIIPNSKDSIQEVLQLFSKNNCNVVSATPTFWRKSLMVKEVNSLLLKRITLGGEIVDKHILNALGNKFDDIRITHIYASTEVGVGFAITDGLAGFPKSFLDAESKSNIKITVRNNLLWINPGLQTQRYLSQETQIFDENGFINTGDLVEIVGDRVFFLGRESGAINVGGNKVQPEEVERVLLDSNLLNSAYVYAKKSPMTGSLVCADVVAKGSAIEDIELKRELLNFCKEHLEAFKRPVIIKIIDEIAMNQSGKVKRIQKWI